MSIRSKAILLLAGLTSITPAFAGDVMEMQHAVDAAEANMPRTEIAAFGAKATYECRAQSAAALGFFRQMEVRQYCLLAHGPIKQTSTKH